MEPYYDDKYELYDDQPISVVPKKQPIINTKPATINDEISKRLHDMELRFNEQGKAKLSYTTICNEPIHPSASIKIFKNMKIDKFRGKEDLREHL